METVPHLGERVRARFATSLGALAERVRFLPHMLNDRFLQFTAAADVMIDTFHFGGCNSTCEALALGTPIVTLPGTLLGGRFTVASYHEIGVEGCVAESPQQYVDIAVALGTDRARRAEVSRQIAERAFKLFDRPDNALALGAKLIEIVPR